MPNDVVIRLSEHAVKRARQRFGWTPKEAKDFFRRSFSPNDLKQGMSELEHGISMWVVSRERDIITIITILPSKNLSRVFKSSLAWATSDPFSEGKKKDRRRHKTS